MSGTDRIIALGVETSGKRGSCALHDGADVLAERTFEPRRGHGGGLLTEIEAALSSAGLQRTDIAVFAASRGPGSFSGVRVGLSTLTALAWALKRPATAFSTLEILAANAPADVDLVAPTLDARKAEVYGALYRRRGPAWEEVVAPTVQSPQGWRQVVEDQAASVCWVGTGVDAYPEIFPHSGVDPTPRAAEVARRAALALANDEALAPPQPAYVRPSEAEVKFGAAPKHLPTDCLDVVS